MRDFLDIAYVLICEGNGQLAGSKPEWSEGHAELLDTEEGEAVDAASDDVAAQNARSLATLEQALMGARKRG